MSLLLGSAAFVALALLLAGTLRAEAVLAVANLVWVLLLGLGVLVPTDLLPGALAHGGRAAAVGCARRRGAARRSSTAAWPWPQWAVLVGWAVAGGLLDPAVLPLGRLTDRFRPGSGRRRNLVP